MAAFVGKQETNSTLAGELAGLEGLHEDGRRGELNEKREKMKREENAPKKISTIIEKLLIKQPNM